ncbi:Tox-REase-5 domain-containing protein [Corallococcus coralloides]|uniref:Tox-REase-5 domain-containing protein n=1 Tax=Corallococcus coralloides TaxID=184914 RepID=UPI00384C8A97
MRFAVLAVFAALVCSGCAGVEAASGRGSTRFLQPDAFEEVLFHAGLQDEDELPPRRNPFTPEDAVGVLERLTETPVTLGSFPPRMVAGFLMREVLADGDVSREQLEQRVERFAREQVAVLRPDGYLAWALDGRTQQKVSEVKWRDGAFRAGNFELGRFYSGRGGVFRQVDAQLRAADPRPLAEVYDDADVINRSLDGAEDAFVELYHAVGQLLSRPADSIAGLRHLPEGLVALITNSPAYWERFQYMTRGEQIRETARLTTNVVALWGTASATTRSLRGLAVGAEATAPMLSLSAEGALVLELVSVPVGRATTVLGGVPGAAVILLKSNAPGGGASSSGGPGKWRPATEHMEDAARKYQAQITNAPEGQVYDVDSVKFDGFTHGVLLEAKGPGYEKFLELAVEQGGWFEGFTDMVRQAKRQQRVARGVPLEWHFAERKVADYVRALFKRNGLGRIPVHFTPPR